MEELQLKIEASQEELKAFQLYLFEQAPELITNETYKHEVGFNKEPVITSIIIALGGRKILTSLQNSFKSFLDHRETMQKEQNRHEEEMFKLSLKAGKSGYQKISNKHFLEMHAD